MGAYWTYRIAQDDEGTLRFVHVRRRPDENRASGVMGIWNEGKTIEDMVRLADMLRAACAKPVVDMYGNEPNDDEDDDDGEDRS